MILFEYINTNIDRTKDKVKIGLISCSILRHWQIYSRYDYYIKIGNNITKSIFFTSEDFNITERTIYRIIKEMESDI